MILRTPNVLVLEIIRAQINIDPSVQIESLIYRLRYNKQTRIGGHHIKHRDTLNPIFNQTFEFGIASSTRINFTLYANHYDIGSAEISLNSNTRVLSIVCNGAEIGLLHFKLSMSKPPEQPKAYLKHNKNVESQHCKRKPQKLFTKTDRDKSYDAMRSQNISSKKILSNKESTLFTKSSNQKLIVKSSKPSVGSSEQQEIMSAYFKKKEQYKKQKASVKTESNSSDLKEEHTSKFVRLENDLKELIQSRKQVAKEREEIRSRIEQIKRRNKSKRRSSLLKSNLKQQCNHKQSLEYIQKINTVTLFNVMLRQKISKIESKSKSQSQ